MRALLLFFVAAAYLATFGTSWLQRPLGRGRWLSSLSSLSSSVLRAHGGEKITEGQGAKKQQRKLPSAVKPTEAQLNPHNYTRTVPMKPLGGESKFIYHFRALLLYKELNGSMLVPQMFHVPWSLDWPEEFWGLGLGKVVNRIRGGKLYKHKREELEAECFDYNPQAHDYTWDVVEPALRTYRQLHVPTRKHAKWSVKSQFVVPTGHASWPEATWGVRLGAVVNDMRLGTTYKQHRPEAEALGLDYAPQPKGKSPGWEFIKATLQVYRANYGDLLVKRRFKVPDEEPWPEDMRGKSLGGVVDSIRNNGAYAEHCAELEELGFDFSNQKSAGWEFIKATLQVYGAKYGDLLVKQRFKVPHHEPWPEDMWGKSLGGVVANIRNNCAYAEHRAELEEMGFDYGSQRKVKASKPASKRRFNRGHLDVGEDSTMESLQGAWAAQLKLGLLRPEGGNGDDTKGGGAGVGRAVSATKAVAASSYSGQRDKATGRR